MIDGLGNALRLGRAVPKHCAGPIIGGRQFWRTAKGAADRNTERCNDAGCDGPCRNVERKRQRADGVHHGLHRLDAGRNDRVALFDAGTRSVRGSHGSVAGDLGCRLRSDQSNLHRRILDGDRQFKSAEHLLSGKQRLVAVRAFFEEPLRGRGEITIVIDLGRCLRCTRVGILKRGAPIFALGFSHALGCSSLGRSKAGDLNRDRTNCSADGTEGISHVLGRCFRGRDHVF